MVGYVRERCCLEKRARATVSGTEIGGDGSGRGAEGGSYTLGCRSTRARGGVCDYYIDDSPRRYFTDIESVSPGLECVFLNPRSPVVNAEEKPLMRFWHCFSISQIRNCLVSAPSFGRGRLSGLRTCFYRSAGG